VQVNDPAQPSVQYAPSISFILCWFYTCSTALAESPSNKKRKEMEREDERNGVNTSMNNQVVVVGARQNWQRKVDLDEYKDR